MLKQLGAENAATGTDNLRAILAQKKIDLSTAQTTTDTTEVQAQVKRLLLKSSLINQVPEKMIITHGGSTYLLRMKMIKKHVSI